MLRAYPSAILSPWPLLSIPPARTPAQARPALCNARPSRPLTPEHPAQFGAAPRVPPGKGRGGGGAAAEGRGGWPLHHVTSSCGRASPRSTLRSPRASAARFPPMGRRSGRQGVGLLRGPGAAACRWLFPPLGCDCTRFWPHGSLCLSESASSPCLPYHHSLSHR